MPAAVEVQSSVVFDVRHRDQFSSKQENAVAVEIQQPDHDVSSKQKIVPGSFNIPLGVFPPSPWSFLGAHVVASKLVERLNKSLRERDAPAIEVLFHENSYWRDHLCLTWDLRTLKGRDKIAHFVTNSPEGESIETDASTPLRAPKHGPIDGLYSQASDVSAIKVFVKVTTKVGAGRGVAKLAEVQGQWKFTLFTTLDELHGHEELLYERRPNGAEHGEHVGRQNRQDKRQGAVEFRARSPAVLIVGAGQSRLTTAARLKALNLDTLVTDHEDRVGDSWRR
ncbi:uncharacterized protein A1O9_12348 [Exophiala aquamarina CBS 119918]|uniref:Uncharacterized protein n=1 Tax=Exophiala aquamarina CBS 119918 TaxID=1182545 RepID=A0A072NXG0_9EURO|nr:uncharacterized protein A1O9_12348 [Exophiala aquamarina CBS 119918]KEF51713.1 hypothetical protein A1O9_12348 [Exophiala aquamarina CBS 119918]